MKATDWIAQSIKVRVRSSLFNNNNVENWVGLLVVIVVLLLLLLAVPLAAATVLGCSSVSSYFFFWAFSAALVTLPPDASLKLTDLMTPTATV